MNTDIRIDTKFFLNAKTRKFRRLVGDSGIVALIRLWMYAAQHCPSGSLKGLKPAEIEMDAAEWEGEKGALFSALKSCGFLEKEKKSFRLHDWQKHNSWAADAEYRAKKARKNAHKRHHKDEPRPDKCEFCAEEAGVKITPATSNATSNAASTKVAMLDSATSNAPAPAPSPSPAPKPRTPPVREAAEVWNRVAESFKRPAATEATITSLASLAEKVTAEILSLRPNFSWAQAIQMISPTSWLARDSQAFSFEWLFKREQGGVELNAVKVWDRRLGAPENIDSDTTPEGALRRMVL